MLVKIGILLLVACCVNAMSTGCRQFKGDARELCLKYSAMKLNSLRGPEEVCNDGSPAGYYVRRNTDSKLWVIYMAGGFFCHDERSCIQRTQYMTTSSNLGDEWHGHGVLNNNAHKNPNFFDANHVYIPYCSSDFWIGNATRKISTGGEIHFQGSNILLGVVRQLLQHDLKGASMVVLAGSSAGGIGVLQNIDRVSELIATHNSQTEVRGIIDSAWFIDTGINPACPYISCQPQLLFQKAAKYWNAQFHTSCAEKMEGKTHQCLYAYNAINYVKSPIFIFQWIYDSMQILTDNKDLIMNMKAIFSDKYQKYISKLELKVRESLKNINEKHGLFVPSCISHTALTMPSVFKGLELNGRSFNDALYCWLHMSSKQDKRLKKSDECKHRLVDTCRTIHCNGNCPIIYHPFTQKRVFPPSMNTGITEEQFTKDLALIGTTFGNR